MGAHDLKTDSDCPPSAKRHLVPAATVQFPLSPGPHAHVGHTGAGCAQDTWGAEGETRRQGGALRAQLQGGLVRFPARFRRAGASARLRGPAARASFLGTKAAGAGAGSSCTLLSLPWQAPWSPQNTRTSTRHKVQESRRRRHPRALAPSRGSQVRGGILGVY